MIQREFFHHTYQIGCAFNLHSINSELILGGQNFSKRQTAFFLLVDPMDKSHEDPDDIDLNVPRHAQYLHSAWKKHQDAVYWVDIDLAIRKGLTFYQNRSNAIILQETLPSYCIPQVVRVKIGEVTHEKVFMSPRPPPKISLKHDWTKELGSKVARQPEGKVARQPEGEVARQAKFFQPTQPIPSPNCDRSGHPDITQDVIVVPNERKTSRSQEISVNSFNEELCSSDRSGQLDITQDVISVQTRSSEDSKCLNVEQTHERTGRLVATLNTADANDSSRVRSSHESDTFKVEDELLRKRMEESIADHDESHESIMVNEADMDFRIPGLPHSVVKHAQSASVRELIQNTRTTQIDILFNETYDKVNHLIPSVQIKTNDS